MYPVKAENVPRTASSEALLDTFKSFGDVGDVYMPVDLKSRKPKKDFAVIRFTDKKAAEDVLQLSETNPDKLTQSLGPMVGQIRLSPLNKQPSFFTNNTGSSVYTLRYAIIQLLIALTHLFLHRSTWHSERTRCVSVCMCHHAAI